MELIHNFRINFSCLNPFYCFMVNIVVFCYNFIKSLVFSYLPDIYIGKFSILKVCTFAASAFIDHIPHIINISAEKQMFRVYARWNVTTMAYKHFIRYISAINIPCSSMSFSGFPFKHKRPITFFTVFCALPQPASFCLFDVRKESFLIGPIGPTIFKSTKSFFGVFSHVFR